MRILLLTNYFPPEIGAASHLFFELGSALVQRGHQVTIVTGNPRYNVPFQVLRNHRRIYSKETSAGMTVHRFGLPTAPKQGRLVRGLEHCWIAAILGLGTVLIPRHDCVLVYSPPLTLGLSAILIRGMKGTPFILNVQDLFPQSAIDLGVLNNKYLIALFRRIEKLIYRNANKITVHSEGNRGFVSRVLGEPSCAKVQVVHNWIDTGFLRPGDKHNEFRRQHGIPDQTFVISFAGTMGFSQDIEVIIKAAKCLQDYEDILFLLVGDGVGKSSAMELAKGLNVKNVKFLPMQPREEYPAVLAASDVSLATLKADVETPVVPSKILSIMSSARPVITAMSLKGDAPKIIEKAECGISVPPEDDKALAEAVLTLYRDRGMGERLGANGRKYVVEHFSAKAGARGYEQLFAEVIESTNQKRRSH